MIGDKVEQLGPGDLIFLRPGVDHILTSEPPHGEAPVQARIRFYCVGTVVLTMIRLRH